MADTRNVDSDASAPSKTLDERSRALKERVYASFTGLAILGAISAAHHATAAEALLSLAVGVFGISAAGFLAEVIAHQVAHEELPPAREVRTMARIALGALGSASTPIFVLALAWAGVLSLEWALWLGMAVYGATLVIIILVAARRSGLRPIQRLVSSAMLVGLALIVVAVLLIAHLH